MHARPVAIELFETEPVLRLIGGKDRASGRVVFPLPTQHQGFDRLYLPGSGTLWTYTIQRFAPKAPPYKGIEPFYPFAVGYVELAGACIVESRLSVQRFEELHLGMRMQLTTQLLYIDAAEQHVMTYAFRPQAT
jgi:uncharacterized OB-fold protein